MPAIATLYPYQDEMGHNFMIEIQSESGLIERIPVATLIAGSDMGWPVFHVHTGNKLVFLPTEGKA